ncbi:Calponin homology domain [Dillenia turbinata]|uniref:Calponin homology domain n=1 Tax=Dillenia turbinata TaxID=194707 RepID=A0AAN8WJ68_9MAGN
MPPETVLNSIFTSPGKNLRGLKSLGCNEAEDFFNDDELALRKAEEAASRRYQAADWLRQMDQGASATLPKEPSEEEFCLALRNGLILCNVLNKVNPGAVLKVVENPVIDYQLTEGAAQSVIQYFENMRNFLVAVGEMKLLTFEASDLEKGGSSIKVVDCILCLKGFYEWKQAGGVGVWRYGGTVKITSFPKRPPSSLVSSDSADESLDDSDSSYYEQLVEFLHLSTEISIEESKAANALTFLFDHFGLELLQTYLTDKNGMEDLPLNEMVIDTVLRKIVKDFSARLASQGSQLGLLLKKVLKGDSGALSKSEFIKAISQYLGQRKYLESSIFSKFCTCGGKFDGLRNRSSRPAGNLEVLDAQEERLEELKTYYLVIRQEVQQIQSNWEQEVQRFGHHIKGLELASSSYQKVLEENRQLYNQIQDLKGTIRVYCRVRPFLSGGSDKQSTVDYIGENGNIMIVNPKKQGKEARRVFSFNRVFGTNVTQQQIYADTQPLIRSVLDGFNACIFAYGQTGSGKTYTMSGPDLTLEETWGVNYRALHDLFQISKARMDVIEYEIGVQMIEIYNEQVRDLLIMDDIRNHSQLNGLNVPDASLVPVQCTQDVLELMKIGQKNRAVGATALNERSSRSHSVLTVHVHGKELVSGSILRGCLHLVDLAGSERVDKSEAVGERLKEAQHINRSLSALGDVIAALSQKSTHIPYRNSKLTQVLQDSLGGQAKTLMFVHINPEVNALGETISTLKFAERVASIDLGAARSNKETGEIRDLKDEISNLKLALEKKEAELERVKGCNSRSIVELQKPRNVSPLPMPRSGTGANMKPESFQRPADGPRILEGRSCSSGKQRRWHFPSAFADKETTSRMPFLPEEKVASSGKPRSPSPPVRISLSTDRGSLIRSRIKSDAVDNPPITKQPFPAIVSVNKSIASGPTITSRDGNSKGFFPQEPVRQENVADAFFNTQRNNHRKLHQEHEDEQFKQALTVRQGGIRKSKNEIKVKPKHQGSVGVRRSDLAPTLFSDSDGNEKLEEGRKSDFSEPENKHEPIVSPVHITMRMNKMPQNFLRNPQNHEARVLVHAVEPLLGGRINSKFPNCGNRILKDGSDNSMPVFRRSRSSPRGNFIAYP